MRSFLGFNNFYRRFIPKFSDIAVPLNPLTGSNTTFIWDTDQLIAFRQLQQAMISPPLLDYPRSNDHFILTNDASEVGAVLVNTKGCHHRFCLQGTLSTRNWLLHHRKMFSYRVGNQEVPPLSDWGKVHPQDSEEVGHVSSSISRWATLLKLWLHNLRWPITYTHSNIDTCDHEQVCKSCGQDMELRELYKLGKPGEYIIIIDGLSFFHNILQQNLLWLTLWWSN